MSAEIQHCNNLFLHIRLCLGLLLVASLVLGISNQAYTQDLQTISFFGTIDDIFDDSGSTGLQSGDEVIIDWIDIDFSQSAEFAEDNFVSVINAVDSVTLSTFASDSPVVDFFFQDSTFIDISNAFSELPSGDFVGDRIDLQANGIGSFLDLFLVNFSFGSPFSGPDGTDPSIPSDIATVAEPLQFLTLLDSSLPNAIGNGQGDFSSGAVSFSFFIDFV